MAFSFSASAGGAEFGLQNFLHNGIGPLIPVLGKVMLLFAHLLSTNGILLQGVLDFILI